MNSNTDNITLFITIILIILFFLAILPMSDNCNKLSFSNNCNKLSFSENLTNLNKKDNITKIDQNKCSSQCCKFNQWRLPTELNIKIDDNFIASNLSCNNGESGGCVCFTKNNFNMLANRGIV
jgi:hypothetical protein